MRFCEYPLSCVCIIRILCLAKMTLMEDTIGEVRVRSISLIITFSAGFLAPFSFFLAGESISGSFPSIFTSREVASGKNIISLMFLRAQKSQKQL